MNKLFLLMSVIISMALFSTKSFSESFSNQPATRSIVVLGDSISAAYGIPVEKGWVSLLQQTLDQEKQPYTLVNESISGDTTAGGLARIDKILDKQQPEIVLLELGANDGLQGIPPKTIKNNLAEMITRSKQTGAKVMLLSMRIPPNYGKRYTELFYNMYSELSEEMDTHLVPFILEDVALVEGMMQQDGLHPTAKAQAKIAEKIWQYLEPVIDCK